MPHRSLPYNTPESRAGALLLSCVLGGCSREVPVAVPEQPPLERRQTRVVHEPCDAAGATRTTDVSGDGKADFVVVGLPDGRCESYDFNFDGRIDLWAYFNADGTKRRTESDYDRDGRVDEVVLYEQGNAARALLATTLAGRVDSWQTASGGRLTLMERDANGDAVVDQWWEFSARDGLECATVHIDIDGDGRPDPGTTLKLCPSEADADALAGPPEESLPAQGSSEVPVELNPATAPGSGEQSGAEDPAP